MEKSIKLPCHVIYVHWGFTSPLDFLEWDLTVHVDPGTTVGEYLALFNGSIDGATCYLGLQTNVSQPETGKGIGKGLIFSTWWSFDQSDTRVAEDGFRELGTHEGKFVGVRRPYPWTTGAYRVALSRSESELVGGRQSDWFDLWITPLDTEGSGDARPVAIGPRVWIGALRFLRKAPDRPATIDPGGLLFLEVYSAASTWADVMPWHLDTMAYGNGTRCASGRTEYPRYPFGQQMPNANVRYDAATKSLNISFGAGVLKQDPPQRWPGRI
ncbi:MAG: hypothetical protein WAM97_16860 [Acidimicrobiales bacterium]